MSYRLQCKSYGYGWFNKEFLWICCESNRQPPFRINWAQKTILSPTLSRYYIKLHNTGEEITEFTIREVFGSTLPQSLKLQFRYSFKRYTLNVLKYASNSTQSRLSRKTASSLPILRLSMIEVWLFYISDIFYYNF